MSRRYHHPEPDVISPQAARLNGGIQDHRDKAVCRAWEELVPVHACRITLVERVKTMFLKMAMGTKKQRHAAITGITLADVTIMPRTLEYPWVATTPREDISMTIPKKQASLKKTCIVTTNLEIRDRTLLGIPTDSEHDRVSTTMLEADVNLALPMII